MKHALKKLLLVGVIAAAGYTIYRYFKRSRDDDWVTAPAAEAESSEASDASRPEGVATPAAVYEAASTVAEPTATVEAPLTEEETIEAEEPPLALEEAPLAAEEPPLAAEEPPLAAEEPALAAEEPAAAVEESLDPIAESRFQDSLREPTRAYVASGDGDVLWRGASARTVSAPAGGFFSDAPEFERAPREESQTADRIAEPEAVAAPEPEFEAVAEFEPEAGLEPKPEAIAEAEPVPAVDWEPAPIADEDTPEPAPEPTAEFLEDDEPADLPDFAADLGIDPEESIEEKFERFTREQEVRRSAEVGAPTDLAAPLVDASEADEAADQPIAEPQSTLTDDESSSDWRTRAEEFATTPTVASSSLSTPVSASAQREAESYLDEGNVYFQVGQYQLAVERYNRALETAPDLVAVLYNRANALTRVGDYDAALADYNRAVELQPSDADALNNRGMLHLYRSAYDDALADFTRALAVDPSDTTVLVNRGLALLHNNNAAAALDDFQQASELDPGDAAAQYGAGQASAVLGQREAALGYLGRAFELDPSYAREASADEKLILLQGDEEFMRLLRAAGSRTA